MPTTTDTRRIRLNITGQVQGVGFRPFVYRLAMELRLGGWVINDARGVTIELEGNPAVLDSFVHRLQDELPPLAHIASLKRQELVAEPAAESNADGAAAGTGEASIFEIRASAGGEMADAQVTVDTAVCADCLAEMSDPADRRYRYPFINCTNCGPRYTIVTGIPYDRPATTMTDFQMCPQCRAEYTDPACRRFHAQPIACPVCGPAVRLVDNRGVAVACDDAIAATAGALADGKIVAIKGLGGFHLACRADDDHVVRRLRQRKHRDAKPFALMVGSLDVARRICEVNDEAAAMLDGMVRPILVLPALPAAPDPAETGCGTIERREGSAVRRCPVCPPEAPNGKALRDAPAIRTPKQTTLEGGTDSVLRSCGQRSAVDGPNQTTTEGGTNAALEGGTDSVLRPCGQRSAVDGPNQTTTEGGTNAAPLPIAPSVAQGLPTLGIMLPYTPLHHLIFAEAALAGVPLVMTSGNYSDEPLVKDDAAAIAHMGKIADLLLMHDRRIERRVDDSVVQLAGDGRLVALRRARGYAPQPVRLEGLGLAPDGPAVLAVGAELKNTVCLLQGGRAVLSEHIGDLKDGRVYRYYIDTINHLEKLFEVRPAVLAADLHPQYLSTQYAMKRTEKGASCFSAPRPGSGQADGTGISSVSDAEGERRPGFPLIRVQHHHAHIAACLAENGRRWPAIGLACDGTGLGDDAAVWGCEVMVADLAGYQRVGHLRYIHLPGGDAAAGQTFRPALAVLHDAFGAGAGEVARSIGLRASDEQVSAVLEMLGADVNSPPSSSLGRWFDAVAGLAGVAEANDFEGQAPMLLEAAIDPAVQDAYPFEIIDNEESRIAQDMQGQSIAQDIRFGARPFVIDLRPMVRQIVADLQAAGQAGWARAAGQIAARFHNTVAGLLLGAAVRVRSATGLGEVALSGGCFANRYLLGRLAGLLETAGFTVLRHRTLPCNDGCVALGQAVVAAARWRP